MKQEAQHLLDVLGEMLAPASATPTPQRVRLDKAMETLREAMKRGTIADALEIVSEYNRGELDKRESEHGGT